MKGILCLIVIQAILIYGCSNQSNNNSIKEKGVSYETRDDGKIIKKKAIKLLEPQKFHLNSKNKTLISGVDREAIYIPIPSNTVEWYCYIYASKENSTNYIQLATQLGMLLMNPKIDVNKIVIKDGNSYCDVFLMNTENKDKFLNKDDSFVSQPYGKRNNFTSGILKMPNRPEYCWLGIENPRMAHAVDVTMEVAAIVEEVVK